MFINLKLYLNKLSPREESFFKNPRMMAVEGDTEWSFGKLGMHTTDNIIKTISKKAGLMEIYTNHRICITSITASQHNLAQLGHNNFIFACFKYIVY